MHRRLVIAVAVAALAGAGLAGLAIVTGDGTRPRSSAAATSADPAASPATSADAASDAAAADDLDALAPDTGAGAGSAPATTDATATDAATTDAATVEEAAPDDGSVPMPAVVQLRLDVAKQALDQVGIPYAVDGGGFFGVVDDTGWTVCETDPAPGTTVGPGVTAILRVDRSCG